MTLSILIWLPLAISLLVSLLPTNIVPRASFIGSLVTLAVAISFLARFSTGATGLQFVTDSVWISSLGIHYKLGLDGLNVVLVVLTPVIFSASLLWASMREWERPRTFFFWFGLAESAVLGAFCVQDLALFVAFFDLMLIPFYFLTGSWGTGDRVRATTKLVVYTLIGSFLMLVAAVATGALASSDHGTPLTFAISSLRALPLSHTQQDWIFLGFAAAFLVKMPLVPFHGWLPDGYKSMPIPAIAVFSAILSKVAAYGFLRIVLPLFPYASVHFQVLMLVIALMSILWGPRSRSRPATRAWWWPTRASPSSASSRSGSSRSSRRAPRGRCCRCSTTRWSRRRCSSSSRRSLPARAARRSWPRWAGSRSGRRCWRRSS